MWCLGVGVWGGQHCGVLICLVVLKGEPLIMYQTHKLVGIICLENIFSSQTLYQWKKYICLYITLNILK